MAELVEVSVSVSQGGKVALAEYGKVVSDFHLSTSERWSVEDMTQQEAEDFRLTRMEYLKDILEPIAQLEFDERFAQVQS